MRSAPLLLVFLGFAAYGLELHAAEEPLRAYRAARVVTEPGAVLEPGTLVVRGRLVEAALGGKDAPPAGAELIDLGDVTVLPGFVNPLSSISERTYRSGSGPAIPSSHAGAPRDARGFGAQSAVRPEETLYRRLGRTGYTAIGWLPDSSGFVAGQAAVIRPRAGKEKEASALVVKESAYLLVSFEMGKRWRDVFEGELRKAADAIVKENEARKAPEKKPDEKQAPPKGGEKKDSPPQPTPAPPPAPVPGPQAAPAPPQPSAPPRPPPPPDPLVRALKGEIPIFLRVRSPAAIDHFFRIADALPVKLGFVLVTPPEPAEAVEKLARRRDRIAGVVLEPRVETFWETSVLVSSARLFSEAGFPVAFVPLGDTLDGFERMPLNLAEMVKGGMRPFDVLAAVTIVPAKLLGLEGKIGTLAKGAFASFCAYQGDPLGGSARLLKVVVEGAEVFADDPATGKLAGEAVR